MGKVFTSREFIDKCKWLVNDVPTEYYSGDKWCTYDSATGKWRLDCVISIKALLWGFKADKNLYHGGAVYKANGVPDFTCNGALDYCTGVSTNFNNLTPGEYLCMKGTQYNHSGIYLGNGKVFECTTGWSTKKCIISEIDKNGYRYLNGAINLRWTYHGKLNYIDYTDEPTPTDHYKERVKELQRTLNEQYNCGLAVDGSFGPLTYNACMNNYLYYGKKAPIHIKWLQRRLIDLGYSVGSSGVDGSFGPETRQAVLNFQRDRHIEVDGKVGGGTSKELVK